MEHFNIIVFGKVQGVFFRANAKTIAENLGLMGWCQNELDGTVHIEVEGKIDALENFVLWCYKGSEYSNIIDVKMEKGEVKGYDLFEIKRF
jgi:acylphosphatase